MENFTYLCPKEKEMIDYSSVIKSISYNQYEIMYNILKLYNNGEDFECDPTYSKGGYYNTSGEFSLNPPRIKFDVFPLSDDVVQIEPLGKLPLDDNSIKSINIDLPFLFAGGKSLEVPYDKEHKNNIIHRRFTNYNSPKEGFKSYKHFIDEAYRVLKPGGICCFKTQRSISSGKTYLTPEMSWMFATNAGFYTIDRFTLMAKNRLISGKVKKQGHSRSFDSQFYVFKKPDGYSINNPVDYYKF